MERKTTIKFKDGRILDIGVDTELVVYAEWKGDDIELTLTSSTKGAQAEGMAQFFLDNYKLGLDFAVASYLDGPCPICWAVRMDACNLSDDKLRERLAKIVSEHNSKIAQLRKEYYSPGATRYDVDR